jgi:predicted Zn-dependent protease
MKSIATSTFALSLFLAACGSPVKTTSNTDEWGQSVNEGKREADKIRNMSDAEEAKQGAELDAALKDPAKKNEVGATIKILNNPTINAYVNRIGQRLAAASTRSNINYTFQVVDSDEINAFATMGGYVYVNSKLVKTAENEAQLAGVIAHEVGHIANRHVVQALAKQVELQGWSKGIGRGGAIFSVFSAVMFQLPKSRSAEFEADELGFKNVRKAGYVGDEMIEFYQDVLAKLGGGNTPSILKTHPDTNQRIAGLQRLRQTSDANGDGANDAEHKALTSSL